VKHETVDFNELLKDISKELEFMDGADSKLVIDNTVFGKSIFYSDNNRIRIVLSNLISNSIRYKDAGKENPFVNINVTADEHFAKIVVEDNGIGIRKEQQDKVFNMFYRVSEQSVGSGLGLYIVKETIEKLKGEISIDSKPGVGTKILVMIPNLYPYKKAS
ncbi:MAG: HAMP domain-containing histidine kinase, partial [Bacteroidia bacterium]|nr:HAMP domain-containing histidine kinase [Bacteroidia bacterium]